MSGMVEDPLDSADISSAEEKRCLWYIIPVSPSYPDLTELRAARSLASLADTCAPPGAALLPLGCVCSCGRLYSLLVEPSRSARKLMLGRAEPVRCRKRYREGIY